MPKKHSLVCQILPYTVHYQQFEKYLKTWNVEQVYDGSLESVLQYTISYRMKHRISGWTVSSVLYSIILLSTPAMAEMLCKVQMQDALPAGC